MEIEMSRVIAKSRELNDSIVEVQRELKRIASIKCRINKMPGRSDYQVQLTAILQEEQLVKNVRDYLKGPAKNVNTLTEAQIAVMSYDEVMAALNCIWSKKVHTRWAEDCERDKNGLFIPGTGKAFKEACRIEELLKERRAELKPAVKGLVSKTKLLAFIDNLRICGDLDVDTCLNRIEAFVKGGES